MGMGVEMGTLAPHPRQNVDTEADQHDADDQFQGTGNAFGHDRVGQQDGGADKKQGNGMAKAPGDAETGRLADRLRPGGERGHGGDMVGFDSVLHADEKAETEHRKHGGRSSHENLYFCGSPPPGRAGAIISAGPAESIATKGAIKGP